jgi:dCTP deaminase
MILSDREIEAALQYVHIRIEPRPAPELWTSTAIDLTLDHVLLRWKASGPKPTGQAAGPWEVWPARDGFSIQAMTEDTDLAEKVTIPPDGYPLHPGNFVLGYTEQSIHLPNQSRIAARVEAKSSLARLGVGVHVTAPTIHAGFGYNKDRPDMPGLPIQLEIFNLGRFIVHLGGGMPICQLILEEVRETPVKGYIGRFSAQETFRVDE